MFFNNSFITANDIKAYVDKLVDKKMSELKVRIPQEQINNAVVKFFTEKKWFLTEDGKKLDTYDLIRKFAMNTIGVADKGEINHEMLKIVQKEVANIIAKEGLDKYKANNNNMYTWTTYTSDGKEENIIHAEDVAKIIGKQSLDKYNADNKKMYTCDTYTSDKKRKDTDNTDETQAMLDIVDEEAAYEQGWIDCSKIVTVYLNSWFKMKGIDAQAIIDPEVNEIVIVDECRRSF